MENARKLSAVALLLLMSCAASQNTPGKPWRIEISTAGGIAGRGVGTYAIDSDGGVTYVSMNGRRCTFTATREELAGFRELLAAAKPEAWSPSYVPSDPCCDRIEYMLLLVEAGVERKTVWIDDPLPRPPDLVALAEAIVGGTSSIRVRYHDRCR